MATDVGNWTANMNHECLVVHATLKTLEDVEELIQVIEFWKRQRWPPSTAKPRVIGASGGRARAAAMDPQARSEQASKAAEARWHPKPKEEAEEASA